MTVCYSLSRFSGAATVHNIREQLNVRKPYDMTASYIFRGELLLVFRIVRSRRGTERRNKTERTKILTQHSTSQG